MKRVASYAKDKSVSLYDAIVENDLVSDENLGSLVSDFLKIPMISLSKVEISPEALNIVPENVARAQKMIAFSVEGDSVKIATSNPDNRETIDMISRKVGKKVYVYLTTDRDIANALSLYKKELQKTFDEILVEQVQEAGRSASKEAPVAKIVDTLIEYAYDNKASDIHIEPGEEDSLVRFRIDGVLHDVLKLPNDLHDQVVSRIKVLSRLRTDEHMSAQDGKLSMKVHEEELDIRVSIVPIVEGEKTVLRLLTSHFRQFGLADLGMNDRDLAKVKNGFMKPYGMVLSTGPTGSGKSTSMYAILKILNTREKNIATIEDPVEYTIDGLNQIQVNAKTNLTFANGLRSLLRQDPDIIYVGEIRDEETADIAINSAMTGHLVLSTLHTNDAATALPRLIDMHIEPFLVASTVNVIIGQRLIRKICEKCKTSFTKKPEELTSLISIEEVKKHFGQSGEIRMYHGKGCSMCHMTGYRGRIGIFEVLEVSAAIQELINQKADSDVIVKRAVIEGMITMIEDGLDKVQQGITTIEEVLRATKE
ncbi:MAG: GspE/PulE family protein [Candidatus Curtissbacteria bacterium]|nr:GspE/PulE family protein [Candidatus Curtissbacteria bacterium]